MSQRQRWTLLVVSVTAFMLLLDLTIVTVALTDIQHALTASFDDLQWVVDAYALTLSAFLLTAGALADRLGRRRVFVLGMIVFTLSSLGCGLAWSSMALLIFRGVQGVGGAILLAAGPALIAQEFEVGPERDKAFAAFGGAAGLAIAAGPLVGGALASIDWRWIFLVNLPVGLLCLVLGQTKLRDVEQKDAGQVDWQGAVLLCGGLFLLTYALIRGEGDGWGSLRIVAGLAGAAVLLAAFVWRQLTAPSPLMDLRLFRSMTFSGLSVATLLGYAAIFPAIFFSTLYLQQMLGYSAFGTGVRMLPLTGAIFVASALAAPLAAKATPRLLLTVGLAVTGVGLLLLRGLTPTSSWTAMLAGFIVAGFGVGVFNVIRAETVVSLVPDERSGEASGVGSTFQEIGVTLGVAVIGALFSSRMSAVSGIHSTGDERAQLPGPDAVHGPQAALAGALRHGFSAALDRSFLVAAIIAFAGAALTLLTVRRAPAVAGAAEGRDAAAEPVAS